VKVIPVGMELTQEADSWTAEVNPPCELIVITVLSLPPWERCSVFVAGEIEKSGLMTSSIVIVRVTE